MILILEQRSSVRASRGSYVLPDAIHLSTARDVAGNVYLIHVISILSTLFRMF